MYCYSGTKIKGGAPHATRHMWYRKIATVGVLSSVSACPGPAKIERVDRRLEG